MAEGRVEEAPPEISMPQYLEVIQRDAWSDALRSAEDDMGSAGHGFDCAPGFAEYQIVIRQLRTRIGHEARRTWADDIKTYAEAGAGLEDGFGQQRSMN
ncbi:MAG: hypothetical protein EBU04_07550 [Verrucomicrobia bacterium]|nr:hypothetical protein [Verrucomicrobiota bacterium]NBS04819.1 hypothetical protein [Verrucomicrobiota bacterium]